MICILQKADRQKLSYWSNLDYFSIIEFNYDVKHWLSESEKESSTSERPVYGADPYVKEEAIDYVMELEATGGTNINTALLEAIEVSKSALQKNNDLFPIIIFLTDGQVWPLTQLFQFAFGKISLTRL